MKRLIPVLLCVLCSQTVYSQTTENGKNISVNDANFSSDRPGAGSDAAGVLGIGVWQIESGTQYSYDKGEINNKTIAVEDFQVMNSLLRLGVLPNMELRFDFTYQHLQTTYEGDGVPVTGFVPFAVGTKISICEEKGFRPKISASMGVVLPATGKKEFQVSYVVPTITFLTETTFTNYLSLTGNFGAEWDVEAVQSVGTFALSVDAVLSPKWGAFVELYGSVPERGTADHLFDAGFVYLAKDNLQFDISSGIAFTEAAPDCFIGLGLSWMLDKCL